MVSILLLSSLAVFSINELASGEEQEFTKLENEVKSIVKNIDGNSENVSVYIETEDGSIAINESEVMSSASIIKTPILVEAIRQAEMGDLVWHDEIVVTEEDLVGGSGDLKDLETPLIINVERLAELMITVSDNTATNMFMQRIGFDSVNWLCAKVGCEDTVLQNSIYATMPQDRGPHNYSTAKDITIIMKAALEGEILSEEGKKEFFRIMSSYPGSRLPGNYDATKHADFQIGHKGGSTASPRVRHDGAIFKLGESEEMVYVTVFTHDLLGPVSDPMMAEIGEVIMDYMLEKNNN